MSELVTGDAVVVELRLAKLASRSLALAIDLVLQGALLLVTALLLDTWLSGADPALQAGVALVTVVGILLGYPVACETLTRGRTVGKLAFGLRTVRDDGGPIRFRHAVVRGLLGVIEIYLSSGAVALVASLASARGKRLGDQLAGTVVVRERTPVQAGPVAAMPPGLAGWAGGLDLSRLPDDLALGARQYLTRARQLAPEVRHGMGGRLAAEVARHVGPAPYPLPPEVYLSAVLAERRQRELARLGRQAPYGPAPGPYGSPPGPYAPPPPGPYAPPAPAGYAPAPPGPYTPPPGARGPVPPPAAPAADRPPPAGPFAPPA